jgi:hypothetical protein
MLKTTLHGAIDKFSHSYNTLISKLRIEIKGFEDSTKDIDELDEKIKDL